MATNLGSLFYEMGVKVGSLKELEELQATLGKIKEHYNITLEVSGVNLLNELTAGSIDVQKALGRIGDEAKDVGTALKRAFGSGNVKGLGNLYSNATIDAEKGINKLKELGAKQKDVIDYIKSTLKSTEASGSTGSTMFEARGMIRGLRSYIQEYRTLANTLTSIREESVKLGKDNGGISATQFKSLDSYAKMATAAADYFEKIIRNVDLASGKTSLVVKNLNDVLNIGPGKEWSKTFSKSPVSGWDDEIRKIFQEMNVLGKKVESVFFQAGQNTTEGMRNAFLEFRKELNKNNEKFDIRDVEVYFSKFHVARGAINNLREEIQNYIDSNGGISVGLKLSRSAKNNIEYSPKGTLAVDFEKQGKDLLSMTRAEAISMINAMLAEMKSNPAVRDWVQANKAFIRPNKFDVNIDALDKSGNFNATSEKAKELYKELYDIYIVQKTVTDATVNGSSQAGNAIDTETEKIKQQTQAIQENNAAMMEFMALAGKMLNKQPLTDAEKARYEELSKIAKGAPASSPSTPAKTPEPVKVETPVVIEPVVKGTNIAPVAEAVNKEAGQMSDSLKNAYDQLSAIETKMKNIFSAMGSSFYHEKLGGWQSGANAQAFKDQLVNLRMAERGLRGADPEKFIAEELQKYIEELNGYLSKGIARAMSSRTPTTVVDLPSVAKEITEKIEAREIQAIGGATPAAENKVAEIGNAAAVATDKVQQLNAVLSETISNPTKRSGLEFAIKNISKLDAKAVDTEVAGGASITSSLLDKGFSFVALNDTIKDSANNLNTLSEKIRALQSSPQNTEYAGPLKGLADQTSQITFKILDLQDKLGAVSSAEGIKALLPEFRSIADQIDQVNAKAAKMQDILRGSGTAADPYRRATGGKIGEGIESEFESMRAIARRFRTIEGEYWRGFSRNGSAQGDSLVEVKANKMRSMTAAVNEALGSDGLLTKIDEYYYTASKVIRELEEKIGEKITARVQSLMNSGVNYEQAFEKASGENAHLSSFINVLSRSISGEYGDKISEMRFGGYDGIGKGIVSTGDLEVLLSAISQIEKYSSISGTGISTFENFEKSARQYAIETTKKIIEEAEARQRNAQAAEAESDSVNRSNKSKVSFKNKDILSIKSELDSRISRLKYFDIEEDSSYYARMGVNLSKDKKIADSYKKQVELFDSFKKNNEDVLNFGGFFDALSKKVLSISESLGKKVNGFKNDYEKSINGYKLLDIKEVESNLRYFSRNAENKDVFRGFVEKDNLLYLKNLSYYLEEAAKIEKAFGNSKKEKGSGTSEDPFRRDEGGKIKKDIQSESEARDRNTAAAEREASAVEKANKAKEAYTGKVPEGTLWSQWYSKGIDWNNPTSIGGKIVGPGTGTSDSLHLMASNGEYVVNARATRLFESVIDEINKFGLGKSNISRIEEAFASLGVNAKASMDSGMQLNGVSLSESSLMTIKSQIESVLGNLNIAQGASVLGDIVRYRSGGGGVKTPQEEAREGYDRATESCKKYIELLRAQQEEYDKLDKRKTPKVEELRAKMMNTNFYLNQAMDTQAMYAKQYEDLGLGKLPTFADVRAKIEEDEMLRKLSSKGGKKGKMSEEDVAKMKLNGYVRTLGKAIESTTNDIRKSSALGNNTDAQTKLVQQMEAYKKALQSVLSGEKAADVKRLAAHASRYVDDLVTTGRKSSMTTDQIADIERKNRFDAYKREVNAAKAEERKSDAEAKAQEAKDNKVFDERVKRRVKTFADADKTLADVRKNFDKVYASVFSAGNAKYGRGVSPIDTKQILADLGDVEKKLSAIENMPIGSKRAAEINRLSKGLNSDIDAANRKLKEEKSNAYERARRQEYSYREGDSESRWRSRRYASNKEREQRELGGQQNRLNSFEKNLEFIKKEREAMFPGGKLEGGTIIDFSKADAEIARIKSEIEKLKKSATTAEDIRKEFRNGGSLDMSTYKRLSKNAVSTATAIENRRNSDFDTAVKNRVKELEGADTELAKFVKRYEDLMRKIQNPSNADYKGIPVKIDATEATATLATLKSELDNISKFRGTKRIDALEQARKKIEDTLHQANTQYKDAGRTAYDAAKKQYSDDQAAKKSQADLEAQKKNLEQLRESLKETKRHRDALYEGGKLGGTNQVIDFSKADAELKRLDDEITRLINDAKTATEIINALKRGGSLSTGKYTNLQNEAVHAARVAYAGSKAKRGKTDAEIEADNQRKLKAEIANTALAIERLNAAMSNDATRGSKVQSAIASLKKVRDGLEQYLAGAGSTAPGNTGAVLDWVSKAKIARSEAQTSLAEQRAHNAEINNGADAWNRAALSQGAYQGQTVQTLKSIFDLDQQFSMLAMTIQNTFSIMWLQQFAQEVIHIGGELEKQQLAMSSILGSELKSQEIYSRVANLSMISPFTVQDLVKNTKQLSAFGVEYNDLYDTVRRLSDISAAVGVDFGRIAYEYGQMESMGYLDRRHLRMFSMSGVPLAQELKKYYSNERGEDVSQHEIDKMIMKRQIDAETVKNILKEMTNEGGKFYNMQQIMAESLAAKYANLENAWNLMLGEIAQGNMGDSLKDTATLLTEMTKQWKLIARIGAFTGVYIILKKMNPLMRMATAGMGDMSSGVLNNVKNESKLQAQILKTKSAYAQLSSVERMRMNAGGKVTYEALAREQKITKEIAAQLYLRRQINAQQFASLRGRLGFKDSKEADAYYKSFGLGPGQNPWSYFGTSIQNKWTTFTNKLKDWKGISHTDKLTVGNFLRSKEKTNLEAQFARAQKQYNDELAKINAKNGNNLTRQDKNLVAWNKLYGNQVAPSVFANYAKETDMSLSTLKKMYKGGIIDDRQFREAGKAIGFTTAELNGAVVQMRNLQTISGRTGVAMVWAFKNIRLAISSLFSFIGKIGAAMWSMVANPYMIIFTAISAIYSLNEKAEEAAKRLEDLTAATKEKGNEGLEKINELLESINKKADIAKEKIADISKPEAKKKDESKVDKSVIENAMPDAAKNVTQASVNPLSSIIATISAVASAAEEASESVSEIGNSAQDSATKAKRALTDDEFLSLMSLNNNVKKDSVVSVMQTAIHDKLSDFVQNWRVFDEWEAAGAQELMSKLGMKLESGKDYNIDELKKSIFPDAENKINSLLSDSADFHELRTVYENMFGQLKTMAADTIRDAGNEATDVTGEEISKITEDTADAVKKAASVPVELSLDNDSVAEVADTITTAIDSISQGTTVEVKIATLSESNPFEGSSEGLSQKELRDSIEKMKDVLREYYPDYGSLLDKGGILEVDNKSKEYIHDASEQFDVLIQKVMQVKEACELAKDGINGVAGIAASALADTDENWWPDDLLDKNLTDLTAAAQSFATKNGSLFGAYNNEVVDAFKKYASTDDALNVLGKEGRDSLSKIKSTSEALNIVKDIKGAEGVISSVGKILASTEGVSSTLKSNFSVELVKNLSKYSSVRDTAEEDAETFYDSYTTMLKSRGIDVDNLSDSQKIAIRMDIETFLDKQNVQGEGRDWFISWLENKEIIPTKIEIEEVKVKNRTDLQKALIGQISSEEISIDLFGDASKKDEHAVESVTRTITEIIDGSTDATDILDKLQKELKKVKESTENLKPGMEELYEQAEKDGKSVEDIAKASGKLELVEEFKQAAAEAKQLEKAIEFIKGGKSPFQKKILGMINKEDISTSLFGKKDKKDSQDVKDIVDEITDIVTKSKDVLEIQSGIEKKLKEAKDGIATLTPEISRMESAASSGGKSIEKIAEEEGKLEQLEAFKKLTAEVSTLEKILNFVKGEMNDFQKMLLDKSNFKDISIKFGLKLDSVAFNKAKSELEDLISKTDDVFETQENVSKELKSVEEQIAKMAPKMMNLQDSANAAGESLADYAASNGFKTLLDQMNALMAKYYELKNMVDASDGDLSDYQKKLLYALSDNYVSSAFGVKKDGGNVTIGKQNGNFGNREANAKEQSYLDQIDTALRTNLTRVDTAKAINAIYKEIEENIETLEKTEEGKNSDEHQWYKNIEEVLRRIAAAGGFKLEKKNEKSPKDETMKRLRENLDLLKKVQTAYDSVMSETGKNRSSSWASALESDAFESLAKKYPEIFGKDFTGSAGFKRFQNALFKFKQEIAKSLNLKDIDFKNIVEEADNLIRSWELSEAADSIEKDFAEFKKRVDDVEKQFYEYFDYVDNGFFKLEASRLAFGENNKRIDFDNYFEYLKYQFKKITPLNIEWTDLVNLSEGDVSDLIYGDKYRIQTAIMESGSDAQKNAIREEYAAMKLNIKEIIEYVNRLVSEEDKLKQKQREVTKEAESLRHEYQASTKVANIRNRWKAKIALANDEDKPLLRYKMNREIADAQIEGLTKENTNIGWLFTEEDKRSLSDALDALKKIKAIIRYIRKGKTGDLPLGVTYQEIDSVEDSLVDVEKVWNSIMSTQNDFWSKFGDEGIGGVIGNIGKWISISNNAKDIQDQLDSGKNSKGEILSDEERKTLEKLLVLNKKSGAKAFASSLGVAADFAGNIASSFKEMADAIQDENLSESMEALGAFSQNLSAAGNGYASSGSWIGAVIGGVNDIITQVIDGISSAAQEEYECAQNAKDFAYALQVAALTIKNTDFENIFGTEKIGKALQAMSNYVDAGKALSSYTIKGVTTKREDGSITDTYTGDPSEGLKGLTIKTKDYNGFLNAIGFDDEYTLLGKLAPKIWNEDGSINYDNLQKFLDTNTQIDESQRKQIQNILDINNALEESKKIVDSLLEEWVGNWTGSLTDAVFDSIINGTNAWTAFEEAGSEAILSLGKQMMNELLFQSYFKKYQEDLENTFLISDEDERQKELMRIYGDIKDGLPSVYSNAIAWGEEFVKDAEANGYNFDTSTSGTANSIKGITEETADILAAYINEIRGDVYLERTALEHIAYEQMPAIMEAMGASAYAGAAERGGWEEDVDLTSMCSQIEMIAYTEMPTLNATAESSLRQLEMQTEYLRMIQESNASIYERVERMDSDLHSVIYGTNTLNV